MKLQQYLFKCDSNGHEFEALDLAEGAYGEFLLRDASGKSVRCLNALVDPTYDEVGSIIDRLPLTSSLSARKKAQALQAIFGEVACDPDLNGNTFRIGQQPSCPVCGTTKMQAWDATQPAVYANAVVEPVTHVLWHAMDASHRREAVRSAISRILR